MNRTFSEQLRVKHEQHKARHKNGKEKNKTKLLRLEARQQLFDEIRDELLSNKEDCEEFVNSVDGILRIITEMELVLFIVTLSLLVSFMTEKSCQRKIEISYYL